MKKLIRIVATPFLLLTLLSASACSSNEGGTATSRIPNGEVITIKSAALERDFSLHVVADRDDYNQKNRTFYVSPESPAELHELVRSNIGKKIRIEWADGLISAAEELGGDHRFAGTLSEAVSQSDNDAGATSSTDRTKLVIPSSAELSDVERSEAQRGVVSKGNALLCSAAYRVAQKVSGDNVRAFQRSWNRARVWSDYAEHLGYGNSYDILSSDTALADFTSRFKAAKTAAADENARNRIFITVLTKCDNLVSATLPLLEGMAFIDNYQRQLNANQCDEFFGAPAPENGYCGFESSKPDWIE